MSARSDNDGRSLRVLQCLRAPLGGLFRHVIDLSRGLAARGVEVGIVCDGGDYGALSRQNLADLAPLCALGVHTTTMPRLPGLGDFTALSDVRRLCGEYEIDLIHGHGAKGGAYARIAARLCGARAVYTPHGGALHYSTSTPGGFLFITLERLLRRLDAPVLFESAFSAAAYESKIGPPPARSAVVHNGLDAAEFEPVTPRDDAADIVFLGELRALKGPMVLVDALERLARGGRKVSAVFIGRGPGQTALEKRIAGKLGRLVAIEPPMPAREAFARGRLMVVPSLAESLPYVVLEAAAAGLPMIATRVGGVPEIFGPMSDRLVEAGDGDALARAIGSALDDPEAASAAAARLRERVRMHFALPAMVDAIFACYRTPQVAPLAARPRPLPGHPG